MLHRRFNVRVYGLLVADGHVLVSHEVIGNGHYVKFPGGGLEFGEGTKEAVVREFMEELGISAVVSDHFYTTDFYLPSAFSAEDQIISIYYLMTTDTDVRSNFGTGIPDTDEVYASGQVCYWHPISELDEGLFSFAADKLVARMLTNSTFKDRYLRQPIAVKTKS
jgi:8-oxo-dGTP diphosphatase